MKRASLTVPAGLAAIIVLVTLTASSSLAGEPARHSGGEVKADIPRWEALSFETYDLIDKADNEAALTKATEAIGEAVREFGKRSHEAAKAIDVVAYVHKVRGEDELANEYLKEALSIMEERFGPDHIETSYFISRLAANNLKLKKIVTAEELYLRALQIKEKALGKDHPNLADDLVALGQISRLKGDYKTALAYFNRALKINEDFYGKDSKNVTESLGYISDLYKVAGKLKQPPEASKRSDTTQQQSAAETPAPGEPKKVYESEDTSYEHGSVRVKRNDKSQSDDTPPATPKPVLKTKNVMKINPQSEILKTQTFNIFTNIKYVLMIVVPIIFIFASLKDLKENERGVVTRLGNFRRIGGPGIIFVFPAMEKMSRVNLDDQVPDWWRISEKELEQRLIDIVFKRGVNVRQKLPGK